MKPPWWLHLTVGCVLVLSGIAAWHSWMIWTQENPVVILHRHLWISEPAWLDEHEHQAMWQEMIKQESRIKVQAEVVDATAELAKAANVHTDKFKLYANELYNRIEKADDRIEVLEKKLKQRRGCGEW